MRARAPSREGDGVSAEGRDSLRECIHARILADARAGATALLYAIRPPRLRIKRPEQGRRCARFTRERRAMTNYQKLPTWAEKGRLHAVVETPRGSHVKLEFDPKLKVF